MEQNNSKPSIFNYLTKTEFTQIKKFAKDKTTPFLVINLKKINQRYDEMLKAFPCAKIFYAMKANPNEEVLKLINKKGSYFDVATVFEIKQLLKLGIPTSRMSFGNTIKKEEDIAYAYKKGIRIYVTDSLSDLEKIGRKAKKSKVFFRIMTEGSGADWPLSKKFGTHPSMIFNLILKARELGLIPHGISFHVGSQQRDIGQWDAAIGQTKNLFDLVAKEGIELKAINMGGGFPTQYLQPAQKLGVYAKEIKQFLKKNFGEKLPEIIMEPGRSITGDSGILVSQIIMIAKKNPSDENSWVFLDIGKFGGLIETIDESIKYPIFTDYLQPESFQKVLLAGPTCDSMDILYEKFKYQLPMEIKENDIVYILSTGAYTTSYSSIDFNGIPPLKEYVLK